MRVSEVVILGVFGNGDSSEERRGGDIIVRRVSMAIRMVKEVLL